MEINNKKNKICIIFPQFFCIGFLSIYIYLCIYIFKKYNEKVRYTIFIPILAELIFFLIIILGIIRKKFDYYVLGIFSSLIFAIVFFFIKVVIYYFVILIGIAFSHFHDGDELENKVKMIQIQIQ